MAAVAYEGPGVVWNRVAEALSSAGGGAVSASPASQWAFQALKKWMSTQKGNPQLGFYTFDGSSATGPIASGGQLLWTGVSTIYAVYAMKPATGVDTFVWAIDDVDDDSTLSTKGNIMLSFLDISSEAFAIYPAGLAFGLGMVIKSYTTPLGTTDTISAADCVSGFVLSAAA